MIGRSRSRAPTTKARALGRIQQWDGKKWNVISDWYTADDAVIEPMVKDTRGQVRHREEDHAARLATKLMPAAVAARERGARRRRMLPPSAVHVDACQVAPAPAADPARVNNIEVIYNHVILVLKGVSLAVPEGGIVALLGANGAGKTTTLKAISNLLHGRARRGHQGLRSSCRGERVDGLTPTDLVRRGVIQVMEGRHCFAHLTVEENLLTGAFTRGDERAPDRRRPREGLRAISRA